MSTCDFLLIGCEGCGKTTLLKQLGNYNKGILGDGASLNTLSTNGVELETIAHKKHKYVVREIGGNFLPVWAKYYESSLMIIYMIDMANYAQLPITCVEFLNLLSHKGLYKKHFLLLLNKIDQPYAMTRAMLDSVMFLDAVKREAFSRFGQTIWIEEISAAKGVGLDKVMFWMHDTKRSLSSLGSSPKGASPSPKNSHSPKGPTPYSPKGVHSPVSSSFSSSFAHNAIYEHALKLTSSKINFINTSFSPPSENVNVHVNINTNTNLNNNNNNNNNINNDNNNDTTNSNTNNNPIITVNPTINIYTTENTKNTPPLSSSSSSIPTTNIFVSNPNSIPDDVIAIASKSKKNFSIHNNTNTNTNTNINTNINNNNGNINTTKSFTSTTTTDNGENTNPNTNTNININDGNNITKIPNSTNTNININNPTNTTTDIITEKSETIKNNLGPIITGVDSPKG